MKHKKRNMVGAVLFAIMLTGCSKEIAVNEEVLNTTEVAESVSEVEVQSMKSENTSTMKTEELSAVTDGDSLLKMDGLSADEQELVNKAVEDIKNYFELTIDLSQYEIMVDYVEKFEDIEATYTILFDNPENDNIEADKKNIGDDGFPTKEALQMLKPEYYVSYSDNKELESISLLGIKREELEVPLTIGECKTVAEEFLQSNNMIEDGKMEFMDSSVFSSSRIYLIYENGADEAIGISVDSHTSKVDNFQYMTKKQAAIITEPIKEGSGLG